MRIAVFGGSGATGRLVVRAALARGWDVTAYVRDASRMDTSHERLQVTVGELEDADAIRGVVAGCDAVISVLGPGFVPSRRAISRGIENIVLGMKQGGVTRLVVLATPSYRDPRDGYDRRFSVVVGLVHLLLPAAWATIVEMCQTVVASELEWTLVRIPLLSNADDSGPPHVGWVGEPGVTFSRLPRATVAEFMVSQVCDCGLVHAAPVISR